MLLSLVKVQGHSMEPFLTEGSFFIASSLPFYFQSPQINNIILFKSENKLIVKKISKIEGDKYYVEGMNKTDSKNFAPLRRKDIKGKLIIRL